jgi:MFS family permease
MYCPLKELFKGPTPFTFEKVCNEWSILACMVCWVVGCSWCFLPMTGANSALLGYVDLMFLIASSFYMIPPIYQLITRVGDSRPSAWPRMTRPPVFLVELLAGCFFMAAAVLEAYVSSETVQLGLCLWFPGSLLGLYLPAELLWQKMEEEDPDGLREAAERQLTPAERQLTPVGRRAMFVGFSPLIVARIATCVTALTVGYSQGSLSGSHLLIQHALGFSDAQTSWLLGITYFVMCIGALPGALLADRVGRVNGLLVVYAMIMLSAVMAAFAVTFRLMFAAQALQGMGLGMGLGIVSIYMTEVGPLASRGQHPAMEDAFCVVGMVVGYVLTLAVWDDPDGWRYVLGFTGMPSLLMMIPIALGLVLESPRYLLMVGRRREAEKSLLVWVGQAEVDEVLATWRAREGRRQEGPRGWLEVLYPSTTQSRMRTVASVGCMMAQMVSGCGVIAYYSTDILEQNFDDKAATWISMWSLTGRVLVNVYIVLHIDTIGRRLLLLLSAAGVSATFVYMSIAYAFDCSAYVRVAGFFLFQIFFAIGLGPVPFVYVCEVVDTDVRSKVVALGFILSRLYAGICTVSFSTLTEDLGGDAVIFLIFAILNGASFWFLYGAARETKGVQLEDMDKVFS